MKYIIKSIIALQNVFFCLTQSMRNILPFSILAFYHLIRRVTFKKTWKCSFPFSLLSLNSSSWDHPTKPSLSLWGNWFREMEWLVIYHFYFCFILCTCVFMTKIRLFPAQWKDSKCKSIIVFTMLFTTFTQTLPATNLLK